MHLLMNLHDLEQLLDVFLAGGGVARERYRLLGGGRGRNQKENRAKKKMLHKFLSKSLPDYLDRITLKMRIGGHEWKFFLDTLRDQYPVEGIAVVKFQAFDP